MRKYSEMALQLSKKAKFNLDAIVIDYFNVIMKADNKIEELEKEVKQLKYQVEFEKHTSSEYLKELKKIDKKEVA